MNWSGLTIPSTFSPSNRPILIHPIATMSRKNNEQSYPLLVQAITKILSKESEKGLAHTVSYDLTKYLQSHLLQFSGRILAYTNAQEKQRTIHSFLNNRGSVILAPSLERGIDLPQTQCRFIIICKVPFPNLATKQVSARLHSPGGQLWYNVKTIRSLVQMTGRGMRSADDYCRSYILDKNFLTIVYKRYKHLLPTWWREALVWNAGRL